MKSSICEKEKLESINKYKNNFESFDVVNIKYFRENESESSLKGAMK